MAIEKVKAFFQQYGMENRIREFSVSSAPGKGTSIRIRIPV